MAPLKPPSNPEPAPVARSVLRYFGGKWAIAPWVIGHLPTHRVYVEPFGGAASVLMRKPRSRIEVYNDMDEEIVGIFRLLQDPAQCARLVRLLRRTPYARAEFERAFLPGKTPLERARRARRARARLYGLSPRGPVQPAQNHLRRRPSPQGKPLQSP